MNSYIDIQALPVDHAAHRPPDGRLLVRWLGQAGFLVRTAELTVVIDAYLSDSLAVNHRGTTLPHTRMMASPVAPDALRDVDWVLCSHAHSDHMDPGTLPVIAEHNPKCRFVVPRAERETALARGVPPDRLVPVNAGEQLELDGNSTLEILPAAHEEIRMDPAGQHHFVGYVLRAEGFALYHSGDCVPFAGLPDLLRAARPDVALLPVNGRDPRRTTSGILGNFSFTEAVDLCMSAGISVLLPHHVGMFDFNTIDPEELKVHMSHVPPGLQILPPDPALCYSLQKMQGRKCAC